jgi:translation initiation factor IF-1
MIEESFIRLYADDFVRMAKRAEVRRDHDIEALPKRIAQARAHAIVMDAKKGPGHLASLAVRLRDEVRRPHADPRRTDTSDDEAISARRRAYLCAIAEDLEDRAGMGPERPEGSCSSDDDEDRGGRIEDGRISYEGVVVALLEGGRRSVRLDNGHVLTAGSPGHKRSSALIGDRVTIEIAIHQSEGWMLLAPVRAQRV